MKRSLKRPATALVLIAALGGCAVGPDYQRPALTDLPAQWQTPAGWQPAAPADAQPKADWWTVFGDAQLDALEAQCVAHNAQLKVALARLDQALAQARIRGAAELPTVAATAGAARDRISAERPLTNYALSNASTVQNDLRPLLTVGYEIDWLGRVRRDVESARATAEQSQADSENVRLLLTAQLASIYFQARQLDEESALIGAALTSQRRVLALTRAREREGLASRADVATQQALTESTAAQQAVLANQRQQLEGAIATLIGQPAASFTLAAGKLPTQTPQIPAGVPATLLERRPDIAAAERAMAAANAQIGVARAAYFPQLTLSAGVGTESNGLSQLLSAPALLWSLGLQASQTIFDGGRIAAGVDFAQAGYQAAVANYRQTVLQAIQETQAALNATRELATARTHQHIAVDGQRRAYEISLVRYREGLDSALTLALNQQNLLAAQRIDSQLRGGQFAAAVGLQKALGGGWGGQR